MNHYQRIFSFLKLTNNGYVFIANIQSRRNLLLYLKRDKFILFLKSLNMGLNPRVSNCTPLMIIKFQYYNKVTIQPDKRQDVNGPVNYTVTEQVCKIVEVSLGGITASNRKMICIFNKKQYKY